MTLRRALAVIAVLGLVWAGAVALSDGFVWRLGSLRISSRDPMASADYGGRARSDRVPLHPSRSDPRGVRLALDVDSCRGQAARTASRRRVAAGVALAIALAGVTIDVYQWSAAPTLWLDEEMIALNVRDRSFADLSGELWLEQSAPYGWLVMQRTVLLTVGDGERALRFVPLVFGIATVVGALVIGRRWLGAAGTPGSGPAVLDRSVAFPLSVRGEALLGRRVLRTRDTGARRVGDRRRERWSPRSARDDLVGSGRHRTIPRQRRAARHAGMRGGAARHALASRRVARGRHGRSRRSPLGRCAGRPLTNCRCASPVTCATTGPTAFHHERSGAAGLAQWVAARLEPLADNPAGTGHWRSLWLLAAAGFALGRSRLAAAFAVVAVSACVYAIAGLVPPYETFLDLDRAGSLPRRDAVCGSRGARRSDSAWKARRWIQVAVAIAALVLTFPARGRHHQTRHPGSRRSGFRRFARVERSIGRPVAECAAATRRHAGHDAPRVARHLVVRPYLDRATRFERHPVGRIRDDVRAGGPAMPHSPSASAGRSPSARLSRFP
jgi:hypothetical protein